MLMETQCLISEAVNCPPSAWPHRECNHGRKGTLTTASIEGIASVRGIPWTWRTLYTILKVLHSRQTSDTPGERLFPNPLTSLNAFQSGITYHLRSPTHAFVPDLVIIQRTSTLRISPPHKPIRNITSIAMSSRPLPQIPRRINSTRIVLPCRPVIRFSVLDPIDGRLRVDIRGEPMPIIGTSN